MSVKINQGWQNAPQLSRIAASQQGGNRGAQLWGVQFDGTVNTIYQLTPGGSWSQWMGSDWAGPGFPEKTYDLAAAQQTNGCVQFWGLDANLAALDHQSEFAGRRLGGVVGTKLEQRSEGNEKACCMPTRRRKRFTALGNLSRLSLVTCYQATPGGQ